LMHLTEMSVARFELRRCFCTFLLLSRKTYLCFFTSAVANALYAAWCV